MKTTVQVLHPRERCPRSPSASAQGSKHRIEADQRDPRPRRARHSAPVRCAFLLLLASIFAAASLRAEDFQYTISDGEVTINGYTGRAFNDTHPAGVPASIRMVVVDAMHYVDIANVNPVPPYTSWATAATNIQDAVDAATVAGAQIWVTNGVYASGERPGGFGVVNRLVVTNAFRVIGVNGPEETLIDGSGSAKCAYLANGAILSGFTLTNGVGGVQCDSRASVVTNCVITGNHNSGIVNGRAVNCSIIGNRGGSLGGGARSSFLKGCLIASNTVSFYFGGTAHGGGAYDSTLIDCRLVGNRAHTRPGELGTGKGGGVYNSTLVNCELIGNSADFRGGGAFRSNLESCLIVSNFTASPYWGPNGLGEAGGGAYMSTLRNCRLSRNTSWKGAGAADSTMENCVIAENNGSGIAGSTAINCGIIGNSGPGATYFDGTYREFRQSILNNCTVVGNSGGGIIGGSTANNSIVYYNTDGWEQWNWSDSTFNFSCTTPMPTSGIGNIAAEPLLTDSYHLAFNSPCRGAGSSEYVTGVDLDGEPWAAPPSIGCDEFNLGLLGPLAVQISTRFTTAAVGQPLTLTAHIEGAADDSVWDFGDGTISSNATMVSHIWSTPGDHVVTLRAFNLSFPTGVSTSIVIRVSHPTVHYVSAGSLNPVPPFTSWATAATTIQDAVQMAVPGSTVLVTNGTYATGQTWVKPPATSEYYYDTTSNRVSIVRPIRVESVNGPRVTFIAGYQVPDATNYLESVRCVYLARGASLSGFTLTNGAALSVAGGVWSLSRESIIANCIISGNASGFNAGGVSGGTLVDCEISRNVAFQSGGAENCHLIRCTIAENTAQLGSGGAHDSVLDGCEVCGNSGRRGGGASYSALDNCIVIDNSASEEGGGATSSTLNNCTVVGNRADGRGGGTFSSDLNNCTVASNRAGTGGGGTYRCDLKNCIVYANTAASDPNYYWYPGTSIDRTCTTPLPPSGIGNITAHPRFISMDMTALNLRLRSDSPCIDAGDNSPVTSSVDLDGRARIVGGAVDMGAYEFQPGAPGAFVGWLEQNGLTTSGVDDHGDSDGDRFSNFAEWRAGTDAFDAQSLLRLFPPRMEGGDAVVSWLSAAGRRYRLERTSNLNDPTSFEPLATVSAAENTAITSYVHTGAADSPAFYRVLVEDPEE